MNSELWILLTTVRTTDMQLLRFVHKLNVDTYLGQNYLYWNEPQVADEYAKFINDKNISILKVETIDGELQ